MKWIKDPGLHYLKSNHDPDPIKMKNIQDSYPHKTKMDPNKIIENFIRYY